MSLVRPQATRLVREFNSWCLAIEYMLPARHCGSSRASKVGFIRFPGISDYVAYSEVYVFLRRLQVWDSASPPFKHAVTDSQMELRTQFFEIQVRTECGFEVRNYESGGTVHTSVLRAPAQYFPKDLALD